MDEEKTEVPGIAFRLLAPGDEDVVRELATYDAPGDPEGLLADPRTLMLVALVAVSDLLLAADARRGRGGWRGALRLGR